MANTEPAAPEPTIANLEFIFAARVRVDAPLDLGDIGDVGKGGRRIVAIAGGEFSGFRVRGEVLLAAPTGRCCAATASPNSRRVAPTTAP